MKFQKYEAEWNYFVYQTVIFSLIVMFLATFVHIDVYRISQKRQTGPNIAQTHHYPLLCHSMQCMPMTPFCCQQIVGPHRLNGVITKYLGQSLLCNVLFFLLPLHKTTMNIKSFDATDNGHSTEWKRVEPKNCHRRKKNIYYIMYHGWYI